MKLLRTIQGRGGSYAKVYRKSETNEFVYRIFATVEASSKGFIAEGFEATDQAAYHSAVMDLRALKGKD